MSPTYAQEIQTEAEGMGLHGLLRRRGDDLVGIVNGIDDRSGTPPPTRTSPAPYDAATSAAARGTTRRRAGALRPRPGPRRACCCARGQPADRAEGPRPAAGEPADAPGGAAASWRCWARGEPALEEGFRAAAAAHPGRVGCVFGYDEPLSHLVQGGADAILVPSRFEPCGLTQLYGLRYGAMPIVARVGGLADTVIDANEAALADGVATGLRCSGRSPPTALAWRSTRAAALKADGPGVAAAAGARR